MKSVAFLFALSALTALSSPAAAQTLDDASLRDVQCMAVTLAIASQYNDSGDQVGMQTAIGTMSYYLGRLEGRDPDVEWVSYFADHPDAFRQAVADQRNFERCGAEIVALGQSMVAAGDRMTAQGL